MSPLPPIYPSASPRSLLQLPIAATNSPWIQSAVPNSPIRPSIHLHNYTQTLSLGADPLGALCESRPHPASRTQFCLVCHTKQRWRPCHADKPPQTPFCTQTWSNALCTLCAVLTGDVMDFLTPKQ